MDDDDICNHSENDETLPKNVVLKFDIKKTPSQYEVTEEDLTPHKIPTAFPECKTLNHAESTIIISDAQATDS